MARHRPNPEGILDHGSPSSILPAGHRPGFWRPRWRSRLRSSSCRSAQTIWLSLQDYLLYEPDAATFVGLGNFKAILQDEVFWISLWHSAIWIVGVVGLQFLLGLVTALLLNQSFWWRGAARALVVMPWALPSVIIGLMWTWMYDFNVGVLNDILDPHRDHRRTGRLARASRPRARGHHGGAGLAGLSVLRRHDSGGLQTIPAELYEAAEIDGANREPDAASHHAARASPT